MTREKALDLFQAYTENKIPRDSGIIIRGFYEPEISYHTFEITQYSDARALFLGDDGITFQSNAYRYYYIIEPAAYKEKNTSPASRCLKKIIPHNFSELEKHVSPTGIVFYSHHEPVRIFGLFSIANPTGSDFAMIFPLTPNVFPTVSRFLGLTWSDECGLPAQEALRLAGESVDSIKKICLGAQ